MPVTQGQDTRLREIFGVEAPPPTGVNGAEPTADRDARLRQIFSENLPKGSFAENVAVATVTMPFRVVGDFIDSFRADSRRTMAEVGKGLVRTSAGASILGMPGIGATPQTAEALRIGQGAIESGAPMTEVFTLAVFNDTLGPLGFTFDKVVNPETGEPELSIGHSVDTIREVAETEPERFLELVGVLATGGLATVAKSRKLSKFAKILEVARDNSDPLVLTGKTVAGMSKLSSRVTGVVVPNLLGALSGAPPEAVRRAWRNPTPEFIQGLRGKVEVRGIMNYASDALNKFIDAEQDKYVQRLTAVGAIDELLDITPLHTAVNKKLREMGVRREADGSLNFRQAPVLRVDSQARNEVIDTIEILEDIGTEFNDTTPLQLDTTKRNLGRMYREGSQSRALVATAYSETKKILDNAITKERYGVSYAEMTKDYEIMQQVVDEINTVLSIDKNPDTALNKLNSVLKERNELRLELLRGLQEYSEADILGLVAGRELKPVLSQGLGRLPNTVTMLAGLAINPKIFALLPVTSPRIIGETLAFLGAQHTQVERVLTAMGHSRVGKAIASDMVVNPAKYGRQVGTKVGRVTERMEEDRTAEQEFIQQQFQSILSITGADNQDEAKRMLKQQLQSVTVDGGQRLYTDSEIDAFIKGLQ